MNKFREQQLKKQNAGFPNIPSSNGEFTDKQDNAGLENIKSTLEFIRAQKNFNDLDSKYHKLKKLNRVSRGWTDKKELDKLSMELGNAAFDLNQADMAKGGDGDYASYDDVGGPGFDQVVQRQNTLNEILKKNNQ